MRLKKDHVRPLQDVFRYIDMKGGDKTQCWPWLGTMDPNPKFYWNKKVLQARRVIYGLMKKKHYDKVPQLTMICDHNWCCNPHHIRERFSIGEKLAGFGTVQKSRRKPITVEVIND